MARIFVNHALEQGMFILQEAELGPMSGLFVRAGVPMTTIEKVMSENDSTLSYVECQTLSRKIKLILSIRLVVWSEETIVPAGSDPKRSLTPKLVSKTIDKSMRIRCNAFAEFLGKIPADAQCYVVSGHVADAIESIQEK